MANADDFKALAQDMANAYKDRVNRIKGIKNETKKFIGTCKEEDKARAADVSNLKAEVGTFLGECKEEDKARAADVSKLKADVGKFLAECTKEDKARAADVSKLIADADKLVDDFKKEQVATAAAWKGLLSTMASARKEKPSPIAKAAAKSEEMKLVGAGEKMPAKKGGKKRR